MPVRFTSITNIMIKLPVPSFIAGAWQQRDSRAASLWSGIATSFQRPGSSSFSLIPMANSG